MKESANNAPYTHGYQRKSKFELKLNLLENSLCSTVNKSQI